MSDEQQPKETSSGRSQGPDRTSRPVSRWMVLAPAAALIVGLVLGGLLVGVAQDGGDDPASDDADTAEPTASVSGSPDTTVVIPEQCVAAAESVEQATALIREGADAIRDFRPEEIIELLNRLEDLDAQARRQAAACADVEISAPADPSTAPTS